MKKSLSLTELIIAIVLLSVIILGATSFDVGSRQFLQSSERKTQVLNEATLVLEHITKNALRGIGDISSPALATVVTPYNETMLAIQIDTTGDGIFEPFVPANPNTTDRTIGYAQQSVAGGGDEVIFMCPNTFYDHRAGGGLPGEQHQILTRRARRIAEGGGFRVVSINNNTATIEVTLRFNPNQPADPFKNPEITAQTNIEVPGYSLQ